MINLNRREPMFLLLGDLFAFSLALWSALLLRYGAIPSSELLALHIAPFAVLFALWVLVFFIAGLYEKHTLVFKGKLPSLILNTQIANSLVAVLFFYMIPFFGITPKTVLVIYLAVSFILIVVWRIVLVPRFGVRRRECAILIGAGDEMRELEDEMNGNERYNLFFVSSIDLDHIDGIDIQQEIVSRVYSEEISSIVIDLKNEKANAILPVLYNLIFSNVRFLDMHKVYEEVFNRVPLSLIGYNWFLENISRSVHIGYDFMKRIMDILVGGCVGLVSLVFYPFVFIAIKLDDSGDIFITQERVGQNNRMIKIHKFRSMTGNDQGNYGAKRTSGLAITRVGKFLRVSRIDELPQLWNVIKGDLSLIGPRPELPKLVSLYEKEIPYYSVRHLVKPGLSGWSQIYHENHPHHGAEVTATREKLSYDLYYIKNRSFVLDIEIALKTIRTLLSRKGV